MSFPDNVRRLVERFHDYRADYESPSYLEARVRVDFINPLFRELGWDVDNQLNRPEASRDVVTEGRIRSGGGMKAPDYLFRIDAGPAFVLEAKKPSINLRTDPLPALQLRRYGWNSKEYAVGILTDFQEFAVYDCTVTPTSADTAEMAKIDYCTFEEYADRWDDIAARFSRESVASGSLEEYAKTFATRRGQSEVDKVFLDELNRWRSRLAIDLAHCNSLDEEALNYATQVLIDRIIFLRICEDRGIEQYGQLRDDVGRPGVYPRLQAAFQRADERYNSGLFHLRPEPGRPGYDSVTPNLIVPDEVLSTFIERLYWPRGPYDFRVFPADVLGQVYEQFLGKRIHVGRSSADVEIVEKPEVRKAGGVYYTPTPVVRNIVAEAVEPLLAGKSADSLSKRNLRICDPSCGSGTFLVEVYQHMLDWYLDKYTASNPERWTRSRPKRLRRTADGGWHLTIGERKRILIDHIYGVDVDAQAVEVAKLSLLLKLLEGENDTTLSTQFELFRERVLPDLDENVKCGNTLVGSAFHLSQKINVDDEIARRVNAFDWDLEFPSLEEDGGFDVIIGNPPWLMAGYYVEESLDYMRGQFATATGKFDLYYLFIEQSLRLLAKGGVLGLIVPNKFFHTRAAKALRELLVRDTRIRVVKDFGLSKVFDGATNYSCILVVDRAAPAKTIKYSELDAKLQVEDEFEIPTKLLTSRTWNFQDEEARALFDRLRSTCVRLEEIVDRFATGIQTGSDRILTFKERDAEEMGLESTVLARILRGRDVRAWGTGVEAKLLLFPYKIVDGVFVLLGEDELAESYPVAYGYLQANRKALESRVWFGKGAEELSGAWYGLMYVERASSFLAPHILTPSLSLGGNFTNSQHELFATGTAGVTGIVGAGEIGRDALLGILNSDLMSAYVMKNSPIYQGGYRKYSAPYLKGLPIRLPGTAEERNSRDEITRLVQMLHHGASGPAASPGAQQRARRQRTAILRSIEDQVAQLYGLTTSERLWVAKQMRRIHRTPE